MQQENLAAEFTAQFTLDHSGPRVVSTTPASETTATFSQITFNFNEAIDQSSAVVTEVAAFTGPGGVDLLATIQNISVNGE